MLDVVGGTFRNCDRVDRRCVLKVGTLLFGGATLSGLLRQRAAASRAGPSPKDTAVIQLFLGGGPSHLDMYDLKLAAPAEVRGEFREISTSVPGIRISELLPRQAAVMDKMALIRSLTHTNSSHLPSSHWMQTGYDVRLATLGRNQHPSSGSITARLRGPNSPVLPPYVAVPRGLAFPGSAYLGAAYEPFQVGMDPNEDAFRVRNLQPTPGLSRRRVLHRRSLLGDLDRLRRDADSAGQMGGLDRFYGDAMQMITSRQAADAFDVAQEDPRTRDRYGRTNIGQNLLLARRLVEAGVTYVTSLSGGEWDTHKDNFSTLKGFSLPRVDQAVSALVEDIHERGLDDRVLVVVMGEFGRTPRINKDAGRDHWPGAMSVLLSGGGLKMGQVIGSTDRQGAFPTDKPFAPGCLLSTIYRVLGIDTDRVFYDAAGRPFPVLNEGRPIAELFTS